MPRITNQRCDPASLGGLSIGAAGGSVVRSGADGLASNEAYEMNSLATRTQPKSLLPLSQEIQTILFWEQKSQIATNEICPMHDEIDDGKSGVISHLIPTWLHWPLI
ncbi:hypothetical protein CAPTEDRAFT_197010 [Capitella teleta]|uniref:Uncharacterized protein n=1 Tax=Capitella teleta TaxID=283909 RepID=R7V6C5_CAPTE|nr:hypothetical protein CAPTEDRAFT_197010 [Capitella teleta]|eukprot:ELU14022.1 hypothetical protein CAPTEDRAFT_197010 [Capitella teleta]